MLLQATSPLRNAKHIKSAVRKFFKEQNSQKDTLASVYEVDKKNGWLMETDQNSDYINFCFDIAINPQRQKLKPLYLPNGAIFIIKGSEIDSGIYHKNTIPFVMDISDSEDIDTISDFNKAEDINTNFGFLKAPTRFFPDSMLIAVFPPTDEST